jgi:hypothetical protein
MIADLVRTIPRFWLLAGAGLAAILVEVAVLLVSGRSLRRQGAGASRVPELVAGLAPLVVVGLWVSALQTCRHLILRPLTESGDAQAQADLLTRGMSGQLNTLAFGSLLAGVIVLLAGVATSLAVAARSRASGLARAAALAGESPERAAAWARYPGPNPGHLVGVTTAFLVLGLGPILRTAFLAGVDQIKLFAAITGADPAAKVELFEQYLGEARARAQSALLASWIGVLVVAAVAVALILTRAPARQRARALGRPEEAPSRATIAATVLFAALAAAAFVLARPLRRENATPWPPLSAANVGLTLAVQTPDLIGPDPVERAPVLVTTPDQAVLGRVPIDPAGLEEKLWLLRQNFGMVHPGTLFNRLLIFACTPDTPASRLGPLLSAALRAGYERPMFTFVRQETTVRPMFGPRTRSLATAARLSLVSDAALAEEGSVTVDLARHRGCAELGALLVGLRRQGKDIALVVGK